MKDAQIGSASGHTPEAEGAAAPPSPHDASFVPIAVVLLRPADKRKRHPPMRRTGHIRQRSPGRWELRYSLGTDAATGKRKIATTTIRGKRQDAERELRR